MDESQGKLLVVDDNEMNRDMLSRRLARRGYSVSTAEDGYKALELIDAETFDVVLLDIMMPGIDGFQVLEKIRETRAAADLPVIMATAKEGSEDIVRALKMGANDYVTKPLDFPVVLARVQTQLSLKKSKEDLEAAARFQHSLLPESSPDTDKATFAWLYEPCTELGGDSLSVFPIDGDHICMYLLDVSGHGVPSALLSVSVTYSLSARASLGSLITRPGEAGHRISAPKDVAGRLNELYPMASNNNHYFTLAFGILDLVEKRLHCVTAGHPGPALVRPGQSGQIFDTPNLPVGMIAGASYDDIVIDLAPGDRLYFYSDGLVEAADSEGEEFGKDRILTAAEASLEQSLEQSLHTIVEQVTEWQGHKNFDDDLSILAVEIPV
jgi:sigma-B regulation protein RsbU (phosphoserine phosphatase)